MKKIDREKLEEILSEKGIKTEAPMNTFDGNFYMEKNYNFEGLRECVDFMFEGRVLVLLSENKNSPLHSYSISVEDFDLQIEDSLYNSVFNGVLQWYRRKEGNKING